MKYRVNFIVGESIEIETDQPVSKIIYSKQVYGNNQRFMFFGPKIINMDHVVSIVKIEDTESENITGEKFEKNFEFEGKTYSYFVVSDPRSGSGASIIVYYNDVELLRILLSKDQARRFSNDREKFINALFVENIKDQGEN